MKKTLTILVVAAVLVAVIPPANGGNDTQSPGIILISDAPYPSPTFRKFFSFLNKVMLEWWKTEGRVNTKGRWKVLASEYYSEHLEPSGAMIVITRLDRAPRRRVTIRMGVVEENVRAAAALAAFGTISVIEVAEKEEEER